MSILSMIALAVAAILGMFLGHPLSKSAGRKEGAKEATQDQQVAQAEAITKSVQERNDVEAKVAADDDDQLDARLQKHNRLR